MERILRLIFQFVKEPLKIALKMYKLFVNKTKNKSIFILELRPHPYKVCVLSNDLFSLGQCQKVCGFSGRLN